MTLTMKGLGRTFTYTLLVLGILPLLAASAAGGGDEETGALVKQIKELQQKVERLEARVKELEQRLPAQPAQGLENGGKTGANTPAAGVEEPHGRSTEGTAERAPGESPSGMDKEKPSISQRWRTLERGMTAETVQALLGLPQRVIEVDSKIVWYYRYPNVGAGSVLFDPNKRVSGWQKPPFHGWW